MKNHLLLTLFSILTFTVQTVSAQEKTYQLSSHILDITLGQPAQDVEIILYKQEKNGNWTLVDKKLTDGNGRVSSFLENKKDASNHGIFKLKFDGTMTKTV